MDVTGRFKSATPSLTMEDVSRVEGWTGIRRRVLVEEVSRL